MEFKIVVIHSKWMYIEHIPTATYFTIESSENTMSPKDFPKSTYTLISCPVDETPESSECWNEVENISELSVGDIAYMNILLKRLFRREILIDNQSIGQRGVSLTY